MLLWQLFRVFFRIGAFTFGGGYAMIPLIEKEVSDKRHWIEKESFLDLLAVAQSAPGPISLNTAVFVGYKLRGFAGAICAVCGLILPSFLIILLIAAFFPRIRQNPWIEAAFNAMRPAVVALMLWPVISLTKQIHPILIPAILMVALGIWGMHISPICFLLAGGLAGIVYTCLCLRKKGGRP